MRFPRATHLPLYRQEDILARHGVEISRATMCGWAMQSADLLKPLYDLMSERVLQSKVIHTDDTTVPVQDRRRTKTKTGRIWVYMGDAEHPYTVYDYTPNRRGRPGGTGRPCSSKVTKAICRPTPTPDTTGSINRAMSSK